MKNLWRLLLLIPLTFIAFSCDEDTDDETMEPAPNLVIAAEDAGLTTLLDAIGAVDGLETALLAEDEITVFAPTNQAFSAALTAFGASNLTELVEAIGGVGNLELVLGFHVVPAVAFAEDLADGENTFTTLAGQELTVTSSASGVTVTDFEGNVSNVVTADVAIENGVVHVIDGVLLPELPAEPLPNLVEAATAAELNILLQAVGEVDGLGQTLLDAEAITVFAPTDAAFGAALEAFDATNLEELVEAIGGVGNLELVLGFHVVPAVAFAEDLVDGENTFNTLAGQEITVTASADGVTVTDFNGNVSNVITADVAIENGVVHVIDGVLLPELPEPALPNLVEAATEAGLTTLLEAVGAVDGLADDLLAAEAITVFAPTNAAFGVVLEAYGVDNLGDLVTELGGVDKLNEVLGYHVVASAALSTDLTDGQTLTTLNGQELTVTINADGVFINDVQVTTADVEISNGVVHVVDGVLVPTLEYPNVVEAAQAAGLTTLIDAVTAADLGATLTGAEAITVFAPTNAAFESLLAQYGAADLTELIAKLGAETVSTVLQFHVVSSVAFSHDLTDGMTVTTLAGEDLTINLDGEAVTVTDVDGSVYNVTTADVKIDNGVVHVIDGVLLPLDRPTLVEAATTANLTTLLDAVGAVDGLAADLLAAEAITVFAPTNDAFAAALTAFNAANLTELIEAIGGVDNLATVLGFHVVPSVAYAADLAEGAQTLTTLSGQDLTVTRTGASVTVTDTEGNTFSVTTADVAIENGVVHVIDGVLLPQLQATVNITVGNSGATAYFVSEVTGADNITTLNENNSTWNLTVGTRYVLTVTGATAHPFALRNAANEYLLSQDSNGGTFQDNADVNVVVDGNTISFTLTQELAAAVDNYVCTIHGSMSGSITVQ
ncbi:fasciclin domain-containing protein [Marivirga sp.]|uniref:fasciclin domain-containing protein n=1 Tax=Marivirga sp. TaxID=2018662 RepID=UPI002D7EB30E|nr:fasciclin domain-containing protein [Marivirga sp.]HET8860041.1 fasciclin domain-containing protein [Marivirga sp.]